MNTNNSELLSPETIELLGKVSANISASFVSFSEAMAKLSSALADDFIPVFDGLKNTLLKFSYERNLLSRPVRDGRNYFNAARVKAALRHLPNTLAVMR